MYVNIVHLGNRSRTKRIQDPGGWGDPGTLKPRKKTTKREALHKGSKGKDDKKLRRLR